MAYNFDKKIVSGKFTVKVDTSAKYGCFEHEELGDECGGGLWFEGNSLTDYDGVGTLPKKVIEGLRALGFVVGEEFE